MQAKHSDDDDDDGEDGASDDQDENILFFEKIRPAIYLLKVRLLSLSNVIFHKRLIAGT